MDTHSVHVDLLANPRVRRALRTRTERELNRRTVEHYEELADEAESRATESAWRNQAERESFELRERLRV